MSLPEKPITRAEQYLASIAGQETTLPAQPVTRLEQYLDYIAKNGGGGGGGLPTVTAADNYKVLMAYNGEWHAENQSLAVIYAINSDSSIDCAISANGTIIRGAEAVGVFLNSAYQRGLREFIFFVAYEGRLNIVKDYTVEMDSIGGDLAKITITGSFAESEAIYTVSIIHDIANNQVDYGLDKDSPWFVRDAIARCIEAQDADAIERFLTDGEIDEQTGEHISFDWMGLPFGHGRSLPCAWMTASDPESLSGTFSGRYLDYEVHGLEVTLVADPEAGGTTVRVDTSHATMEHIDNPTILGPEENAVDLSDFFSGSGGPSEEALRDLYIDIAKRYASGHDLYAHVSATIGGVVIDKTLLPISCSFCYLPYTGEDGTDADNVIEWLLSIEGQGAEIISFVVKPGSLDTAFEGGWFDLSVNKISVDREDLIPANGQAGQILMSDGNGGVYWGNPT